MTTTSPFPHRTGSIGACDEVGLYVTKHGRADEARPFYQTACDAGGCF